MGFLVERCMIFNTVDFHVHGRYGEGPLRALRPFRLRINHIVDSFSLRIPKKTRTELFHKLNVCVSSERLQKTPFFALEGIVVVEIVDPEIDSIYKTTRPETIKRVKRYLKRGIRIAAKNDRLFAKHIALWNRLLSTTEEEFDYDCRIARSHRSRRWRCQAVLRMTSIAYHYDVLIKDSRSLQTIQRHRIKTTECCLPFFTGIGFSKLRWDGADVVGYTRCDKEEFRFHTGLPA
jgi:hypothetical protein